MSEAPVLRDRFCTAVGERVVGSQRAWAGPVRVVVVRPRLGSGAGYPEGQHKRGRAPTGELRVLCLQEAWVGYKEELGG